MVNQIRIFEGGISIDDRGEVFFVNDFAFAGVKRFYVVSNHRSGFIRAWHGHQREAKYITAVKGAALVGAVKVHDWANPDRQAEVSRFALSAKKPQVIYIPPGYANGFMSLTPDLKIIFFSTVTIKEARHDDFRYDPRYWDIWDITER